MIVAQTKDKKFHLVDHLANRGEWFNETWLVTCNIGVFCYKIGVEGEHEQAVIDALADSHVSRLIDDDEPCPHNTTELWDNCDCDFAGNDSHRIDLSYTAILGRCKVQYFENPKDWDGITAWGGCLERVVHHAY